MRNSPWAKFRTRDERVDAADHDAVQHELEEELH
jgi:hypothetical protein